ncbi:fungal-specific transcription factor domain-containing protein [Scheffersomyces amazonensis]|uniref:fungal-specific transcription factor domain-containing protein n=1 Tax=Scheffersomyces amazonensis TaxID=1078765 RepID=UPI00315C5223
MNGDNNLVIQNPELHIPTEFNQPIPYVKIENEDNNAQLLLSSTPPIPIINSNTSIPAGPNSTFSNLEFVINYDEYFSKTFTNNNVNIFNPEFYQNNFKLESEVFNYFVDTICPGCICYPRRADGRSGLLPVPSIGVNPDLNPYLYLVVPLAQVSPIVYKALVAVASKQLSLLGNTKFEYLARNYTSEILQKLPMLIKEKQLSRSSDWDEVLATVLMLCFTDISSSCGNSWLIHLNGAKEFLKDSTIRSNLTPVAKFFIRYFIAHEVMGETAWFQNKIIEDDDYLKGLKSDTNEQIDLIIGASPHLLSIINQISRLGETYESFEFNNVHDKEFLEIHKFVTQQRDKLEVQLNTMRQFLGISELDNHTQESILKISEIKKLTTLLYLHARVDLEYLYLNHSKIDNNGNRFMEEPSKLPKKYMERIKGVKEITKQLMIMIKSLPVSMSLLWPLFVMGIVGVENDEQRWFVLSRLIEMEKIRELASVKITRRVVESVWKEKDLNCLNNRWKDMIKGKANTISLA